MKRQLENWLIAVLLLLACMTGLAWLHSSFIGYQRTWSNSRQQSCGRFASLRGHILWQRCDLAPFPVPDFVLKLRVAMPADFVVGSDPAGEREIVNCGSLAVPFASPQHGLFIGWQTSYASSTGGANQTRWSARWSETTISYWLVMVLLALYPAEVGLKRLFKRITRVRGQTTRVRGQTRGHVRGQTIYLR